MNKFRKFFFSLSREEKIKLVCLYLAPPFITISFLLYILYFEDLKEIFKKYTDKNDDNDDYLNDF